MNRTSQQIKRDMLEWAKHHLDIRASDEYGYDVIDADPLIHLLIGACAAEAKSVYDAIRETDDRLHQRLLRYLLPEAFQYPRPAFGILKVQPTSSFCHLTTNQEFKFRTEEKVFSFCPLFDTTLVGGQIRFLGLDPRVIEYRPGSPYFSGTGTETVSRILIGMETKEPIDTLENVAFYVDWRGTVTERQALLLALSNSHWTCNGKVLSRRTGLVNGTALLSDQFSAENRLVRQVGAQFRLNFQVITDPALAPSTGENVQEVLTNWLGKPSAGDWTSTKGAFTWIRIDLPYALQLSDVERNLVIDLNHFPVANRRMIRKADQGTYFSKSLGFEAVALQSTSGYFCGIQSVLNQETGEEIPSKEFSRLVQEEDDKPGYSLRYGGTGRYDDLNAWERLSYLLSLFRQEHKDREVIEELGVKLTLEELHEALGKRMLKGQSKKAENGRFPPVYIFFRLNPSQKLDAEVRYWVTDGEAANQIPEGSLCYAEPPIPGIDPASPKLATSTIGGKTHISETEQTQILQDLLFRRERIVTTHDIKSLCRKLMGEHLREVGIHSLFEADMNNQGGIRRAIKVELKVDEAEDVHLHQVGQEIETILQENSTGTVPYRVVLC
ncbi:MAG: type VI secretion system baseplate subunit TssF [Saprospirales bacterium]|nr:type VI secretion system baseplate subunit TssF [Saprospirales bacterium]